MRKDYTVKINGLYNF
ncbi:hypothetical protein CSPAE12_00904 [Colletotrichum incanum]|nr:hypothetical protein CSPAE12_00904 [Colletotrichum incanum]